MSKIFDNIRVRFAPSPTGFLHVGGARTAIFNWLFARKHEGQFLLRLEDTDATRSDPKMVDGIFEGLEWLGLKWDEDPVFQSQRLERYRRLAEELLRAGKAYRCFCSPERLKRAREKAAQEKQTFKYDRRCLHLSDDEKERLAAQHPSVVRLYTGDEGFTFHDEVYGDIKVSAGQIDDFIILRSDGRPTYHFAVVIDDHEMEISHVIRGEDHVSNTPKHLMLYRAFGWTPPVFVHLPLILGPDQQRLSKRHGATAVGEYRKAGYLPEAMFNFLAILGWSSGDDRELFSRDQLIQEFDLSGIMKKSAVFDERKLQWMNAQYLIHMEDAAILDAVLPQLVASGLIDREQVEAKHEFLLRLTSLLKTRMRRLTEFPEMARYFFADPETYEEQAVKKHWKEPDLTEKLTRLRKRLATLQSFTAETIEAEIRALAEELQVSAAKLIHPMRVALTGVAGSPGLFEVMEILGQETVLRRIQNAQAFLQQHSLETAV